MDIITRRNGSIIKDNTSLRLTLSDELIDLGCEKDKEVLITLLKTDVGKRIMIEKA